MQPCPEGYRHRDRPTAGWPSARRERRASRDRSARSSPRGRRWRRIYREIERPLTPVLARMELYGVAIDAPYLDEMSARMEKDLRALEQTIWAGGRRGVQRQLARQARHDPLREARLSRS